MQLTENIAQTFRVAQVFRENETTIRCLEFSPNGDFLITCAKHINLYDCYKGVHLPESFIRTHKYGVDNIKFVHNNNAIIHTSTMINDGIRFLNLEYRKYLRYFNGHCKKVTSISVSPVQDSFASVSMDKTLKLWDFRAVDKCESISLPQSEFPPKVAIDPEGLVIAVGFNSQKIILYDIRKIKSGSYLTSPFIDLSGLMTDIKFSKDGKKILFSTTGNVISMVDAFRGNPLQNFSGFENVSRVPIEASFSSDDQFVYSGSNDGKVHFWDTQTGFKVSTLDGDHPGPVQCVKFNPKLMMLASSCANLAFWLPTNVD